MVHHGQEVNCAGVIVGCNMIVSPEHVVLKRGDPTSGISHSSYPLEGDTGTIGEKAVAVITIGTRVFQLSGRAVRSGIAVDMATCQEVLLDVE